MPRLFTIALFASAGLIVLLVIPVGFVGGTRIVDSIDIERPPAEVFDYVTTPGNWPRWHPASLKVAGAIDHPLAPGEKVIEDFLITRRTGRALWTVVERDRPRRWTIEGHVEGGGEGTVSYLLRPQNHGTRFVREFVYQRANLFIAALDALYVRGRIAAESTEALRRLKAELEKAPR